jgi:hypothetical protein
MRALTFNAPLSEADVARLRAATAGWRGSVTIVPNPPVVRGSFLEILRWLGRETGLEGAILSAGRKPEAVRARFAAIWGGRVLLGMGWSAIGRRIGRDHSTVLDGFHRAEVLRIQDADFRDLTDRLVRAFPQVPA